MQFKFYSTTIDRKHTIDKGTLPELAEAIRFGISSAIAALIRSHILRPFIVILESITARGDAFRSLA